MTGWLVIYFQPIYDISEEIPVVYGYEALLRVKRGDTVTSAENLVLEAERCGAIISIDCWVLRVVVSLVKHRPGIRFSINASQLSLESQRYLSEALEHLTEQPIGKVSIEVTETASASLRTLTEHLQLLHMQAIPVILDDVLDGHAKLGLLRESFVSGCKISRQSTLAATRCQSAMRGIQELISACEAGNKVLVIEGIETAEELLMARAMGLKLCQGYYFEKPRDSETLFGIPAPSSPVRIHFETAQSDILVI